MAYGVLQDRKFFELVKKWVAENVYLALKNPNVAIYTQTENTDMIWNEARPPYFVKKGEVFAWFEFPEKRFSYEERGTVTQYEAILKVPRLEIEKIGYTLKDGDLIVILDYSSQNIRFIQGKLSRFMIAHTVWYDKVFYDNPEFWVVLSAGLTEYTPQENVLKSFIP